MKVTGSDFDGTITTNNVIVIKPHHLLDIFKLYGKGIENFIPDKNYNHNFYLIGNAVIRNEVNKIRFTYSYDCAYTLRRRMYKNNVLCPLQIAVDLLQ